MARLVPAIDVASYQPRDLGDIIREHRPAHVVVRMYLPGERPSPQHSIDQVSSARAEGCTVGAYLWAYQSFGPRESVRHALELARLCGMDPPPVLWIDCETFLDREPGPDADWLRTAVEECRVQGALPGIYTAGWWWRGYMANTREFADLPLWTAEYDGIANLGKVQLYGGWTRACGKQWAGTGLDRDVFLEEVCALESSGPATVPTLEELGASNPHLREQLAGWQAARLRNGEDPHDYPEFRRHLLDIHAPDSGPMEFAGFLRPTIDDLRARNPYLREQTAEWQAARIGNGEDPHDYAAFRRHLIGVYAPDPGPLEFIGFRG